MTANSVFKNVDLHCATNNAAHHTNEISGKVLIVRRGEPFTVTVTLSEPFKNAAQPLFIRVNIGEDATEEKGTLCMLSVPDGVSRSQNAKAVWKVEQDRTSSPSRGVLVLNFTPPADAPIGRFFMAAKYGEAEKVLGDPVVLYNPWCREDAVFMPDEKERQEYVMNEHGRIYKGSTDYIMDMDWDYGQFEENMVEICLSLLNISNEHQKNPAEDLANRASPAYVGRLISAMINSDGDYGVLEGNWGGYYLDGYKPTHWTGSSAILTQWLKKKFRPVKYGQCWVFAGVMCSVLRFLGIPCRVISNYNSAHDTNANLTIDVFRAEEGAMMIPTKDSIWNFHVWVEGYMRRPDLDGGEQYDGWQVLDPTPQELSDGVFCCGPAPKAAILNGEVDIKYDVPFVFAEVNADINVWLTKLDYSLARVQSDATHVGKNISTKAVGTEERVEITPTYKAKEGTALERMTFFGALITNYKTLLEKREEERRERERPSMASSAGVADRETTERTNESAEATIQPAGERDNAVDGGVASGNADTAVVSPAPAPRERDETPTADAADRGTAPRTEENVEDLKVVIKFEEVTKPMNSKDVELNLLLKNEGTTDRRVFIVLEVHSMTYFGRLTNQILRNQSEDFLKPGKTEVIPVKVPFSEYCIPMLDSDSMMISAMVQDQDKPHQVIVKDYNVVLLDPPIYVKHLDEARLFKPTTVEVIFENPVNETLKNCTLTISGSGLEKGEHQSLLPNVRPSRRLRIGVNIVPYKVGRKTLTVDFDCSLFRDVKGTCIIDVKP